MQALVRTWKIIRPTIYFSLEPI